MVKKKEAIFDHKKAIALYQRRAIVTAILVLLLTAALFARMFYLQVTEHARYTTLSESNQLMIIPNPPHRGIIYDRNGIMVAENIAIYNLKIIPDKVKDIPAAVQRLKDIIEITPEDLKRFKKQRRLHHRHDKITLKQKLTDEEIARFYVNQYFFPGLSVERQLLRFYPYHDILVDVLGYVGRINDREVGQIDSGQYAGTHYIGKIGIEKYYENLLHGKVGNRQVEVDAAGRIIRTMKDEASRSGHDVYLTIDLPLQQTAKKALAGLKGAVIAIAPQTGEVLALASSPSYDPNLFVNGISVKDYSALRNSPDQPLFNRAIRGQYPQGSTIKPFFGIGGLEYGFANKTRRIRAPGWYKLNFSSQIYRCWRRSGHGLVNLSDAIRISCDIFFYDLAYRMGIERMGDILFRFGFGQLTGIEIQEELPGLVPTSRWKKASYGHSWYPGDTISAGIGQGYMLTTPLQLAHATATMANRGKRMMPHLLLKQRLPDGSEIKTEPIELPGFDTTDDNWDFVIKAMQKVVSAGTARRFGKTPYTVAAKTGTAQIANLARLKALYGNKVPKHLRDNTLFIVFAPVEDPQIAVAAVIENSREALTVAKTVIQSYMKRQGYVPNKDTTKTQS